MLSCQRKIHNVTHRTEANSYMHAGLHVVHSTSLQFRISHLKVTKADHLYYNYHRRYNVVRGHLRTPMSDIR